MLLVQFGTFQRLSLEPPAGPPLSEAVGECSWVSAPPLRGLLACDGKPSTAVTSFPSCKKFQNSQVRVMAVPAQTLASGLSCGSSTQAWCWLRPRRGEGWKESPPASF